MAMNALNLDGALYLWQKLKNLFVRKEEGKGLSSNDFTTAEKNKLQGLSNYELPTAGSNTKGGIKVGAGLEMVGDTLNATGGGTADSVDWSNVQNKPTTYPPETHTHTPASLGAIPASEKGSANGVPTLDSNGLIPASQIPGAFDDVVDGYYDATQNKFFADSAKTTELEKIVGRVYVDLTDGPVQYRWGGSTFSAVATVVVPITNAQIDAILAT